MSVAIVAVAVGLLATGCASKGPPPPSRPEAVQVGAAAPAPAIDRAAALESTLAAEGLRVKVSSNDRGRHVALLRFEDAPLSPYWWRTQLLDWLRQHGAALGYGALGRPRWGHDEAMGGVSELPDAEGCPGLLVEAAFERRAPSPGVAPVLLHVACPSDDGAPRRIAEVHALIVALREEREARNREVLAQRLAADPLVVALRGAGLSVRSVHRYLGRVRAVMNPVRVGRDRGRLAYALAVAEQVRVAERLPPLDAVALTKGGRSATESAAVKDLPLHFDDLVVRLERPRVGERFLDPSVDISVVDDGDGFAITAVEVDVAK